MATSHDQDVYIWTCSTYGNSQLPSACGKRQESAGTALPDVARVLAQHLTVSRKAHVEQQCCTRLPLNFAIQGFM